MIVLIKSVTLTTQFALLRQAIHALAARS